MENGIFVNIFLDLAISLVAFVYTITLHNKYCDCNEYNRPTQVSSMMIWVIVSIFFIIDAIRQLVVISGNDTFQMQLYLISLVPLSLVSLPIVFIVIYIVSGNRNIGIIVSSIFLFFGFLYIYSVVQMGGINFITTSWGSLVISNNEIANTIFLSGLFIVPTSLILGLLILILFKRIPMFRKHKICISLLSISMVYDFLLLNSISQTGEMMVASKIFIFLGVVLSYLASFPPKLIESRYDPDIMVNK
jgi:hypothetical protein